MTSRLKAIDDIHILVTNGLTNGSKLCAKESVDVHKVIERLVQLEYLDPSLFSLPIRCKMSDESRRKIQALADDFKAKNVKEDLVEVPEKGSDSGSSEADGLSTDAFVKALTGGSESAEGDPNIVPSSQGLDTEVFINRVQGEIEDSTPADETGSQEDLEESNPDEQFPDHSQFSREVMQAEQPDVVAILKAVQDQLTRIENNQKDLVTKTEFTRAVSSLLSIPKFKPFHDFALRKLVEIFERVEKVDTREIRTVRAGVKSMLATSARKSVGGSTGRGVQFVNRPASPIRAQTTSAFAGSPCRPDVPCGYCHGPHSSMQCKQRREDSLCLRCGMMGDHIDRYCLSRPCRACGSRKHRTSVHAVSDSAARAAIIASGNVTHTQIGNWFSQS